MSDSVLFDTQRYVDQLIEAGVPERQAKAHAKGLVQWVESQLHAQADKPCLNHEIGGAAKRPSLRISGVGKDLDTQISNVGQRLYTKIDGVEQRLHAKIDSAWQCLDAGIDDVDEKLDAEIDGVEKRLDAKIDTTMWALGLMIAAFGILISVLSVVH